MKANEVTAAALFARLARQHQVLGQKTLATMAQHTAIGQTLARLGTRIDKEFRPEPPVLKRLAAFLRDHRKKHRLTRKAAARQIGCSVGTISSLENGHHQPVAATLQRLASWSALPEDLRRALRASGGAS